jgi:polysaccharide export outer membrane protein
MNAFKSLPPVRFALALIFIFGISAFAQETVKKETTENVQPAAVAEAVKNAQAVKRSEERYRIGLQDVLEVTVYRHPELSQPNIRMDDSGQIRLPRIDKPIAAICKTENELGAEIAALYRENYLRDPYVTVFVKEQNSQPLSVIGAVEKPGNFFTNRRLTLLELLSFAGGQDVEKAGSKIQVARVGGISGCKTDLNAEAEQTDAPTFFSYNLADVLKGKTNPVMRPGDIVVVLETEQAYVTGNVLKPQAVPLKQTVTLTQAIAAAGGTLPATKKNQVRIVRQGATGGLKQELLYDLTAIKDKKIDDPVLQANDIVEVPTDKVKDFSNNVVKAITGGASSIFYRIP